MKASLNVDLLLIDASVMFIVMNNYCEQSLQIILAHVAFS